MMEADDDTPDIDYLTVDNDNVVLDQAFLQFNVGGSDTIIHIDNAFASDHETEAYFLPVSSKEKPEEENMDVIPNVANQSSMSQLEFPGLQPDQTVIDQEQQLTNENCHITICNTAERTPLLVQDLDDLDPVDTVIYAGDNDINPPQNEKLMQLAQIAHCAEFGAMSSNSTGDMDHSSVEPHRISGRDFMSVEDSMNSEHEVIAISTGSELHLLTHQAGLQPEASFYVHPSDVRDKEVSVIQVVSSVMDYSGNGNTVNGQLVSGHEDDESIYVIEPDYDQTQLLPERMAVEILQSGACSDNDNVDLSQTNEMDSIRESPDETESADVFESSHDATFQSSDFSSENVNQETSGNFCPSVIRKNISKKSFVEDQIPCEIPKRTVNTRSSNRLKTNSDPTSQNLPSPICHNDDFNNDIYEFSSQNSCEDIESPNLQCAENDSQLEDVSEYCSQEDAGETNLSNPVTDTESLLIEANSLDNVPNHSPDQCVNAEGSDPVVEKKNDSESPVETAVEECSENNQSETTKVQTPEIFEEPIMIPPKRTYGRRKKPLSDRFGNESKVAGIESDLKLLSNAEFMSSSYDFNDEEEPSVSGYRKGSYSDESPVDDDESISDDASDMPKKRRRSLGSESPDGPLKKKKKVDLSEDDDQVSLFTDVSITPSSEKRKTKSEKLRSPISTRRQNEKIAPVKSSDRIKKKNVERSKSKLLQNGIKKTNPPKKLESRITKLKYSNKSSKWFYSKPLVRRGSTYDPSNEYNFTDSDTSDGFNSSLGYSSSKKRGRPSGTRNRIVNNNDMWNKLLASKPKKARNTSFLSKLKKRYAKAKRPDSSFSSPSSFIGSDAISFRRTSNKLKVHYMEQVSSIPPPKITVYCCFLCHYETERIETYIVHMKLCLADAVHYHEEELTDMERRQRIRGDFDNEPSTSSRPTPRSSSQRNRNSNNDDDLLMSCLWDGNTVDFIVDDVVWVERKRGYWPAWVQALHENEASVMLIDFPSKRNFQLKVPKSKLVTFHDAKINRKFLGEGKTMLNGEQFIKAVQKAEEFVRKRCIGVEVNPAQFFRRLSGGLEDESFNESMEVPTVTLDDVISLNLEEITDPFKKLSVQVLKYVVEGNADEYLVDMYTGKIQAERHRKFFSQDAEHAQSLMDQSWFGPIQEVEQNFLYAYLVELFKEKCATRDKACLVRYVYYVWCPEVIVKSIAVLQNITQEESEKYFLESSVEQEVDIDFIF